MDKIRVLIVDDHPLMLDALRDAIEIDKNFEIIGEGSDGQEAIELAGTLKPEVILMDLSMPLLNGIEATKQILRENPEIKILAITSSGDDETVIEAIRAGVVGYILKSSKIKQILAGLHEVANGRSFIPEEVGEKLVHALQAEQDNYHLLSPRESDLLQKIGEGKSNREIAQLFVLSEATVRSHVSRIMQKLDLHHRSQLILYANKHKPK